MPVAASGDQTGADATGQKAAEESSFKKLGPRQWGAKAGVQKLGPDVVN